jgi:hypothetical protein
MIRARKTATRLLLIFTLLGMLEISLAFIYLDTNIGVIRIINSIIAFGDIVIGVFILWLLWSSIRPTPPDKSSANQKTDGGNCHNIDALCKDIPLDKKYPDRANDTNNNSNDKSPHTESSISRVNKGVNRNRAEPIWDCLIG